MTDIVFVAVNSKYIHTNPAVRSIKYYIEKRGLSSHIVELTDKEEMHRAAAKIVSISSKYVAFSCYIWNSEYILKLAQTVKKACPDRKIVLGGPEAYCNAEKILNENTFIDHIISGEGEKATFELVKNGICDKVIVGEKTDLSEIGFIYSDEDLKESERIFYYESSRGCPYNCSYCLSCIDKGVRYKPVEQVQAELERFAEANVKLVKFVDRTFNSDIKRSIKLLEIINELKGDTQFHLEINPDSIDDRFISVLANMKEGKVRLEAGLQSRNEKTLAAVSRKCDFDLVEKNIKSIKKTGTVVHLDLIAGLPYEDIESFKESFNFAFSLGPDELQLGFLKVLPGTDISKVAQEHKMVYDEFAPYEIISNKYLSMEDVIKLKNIEAVLDIYHNSGMLKFSEQKLISKYDTPFDFFEKLSDYMLEKGFLNAPAQKSTRFENLYGFVCRIGLEKELLKDYFLSCRGGNNPSWLDEGGKVDKKKLNLYLSEDDISAEFPKLSKVKFSERHKHVKAYSFKGETYLVSYPDKKVGKPDKLQ